MYIYGVKYLSCRNSKRKEANVSKAYGLLAGLMLGFLATALLIITVLALYLIYEKKFGRVKSSEL